MKIQTFTVSFRGAFPLDMLRYDSCYPLGSDDVDKIHESWEGRGFVKNEAGKATQFQGTVRLQRRIENKREVPTIGRWESFGCSVSQIEVR